MVRKILILPNYRFWAYRSDKEIRRYNVFARIAKITGFNKIANIFGYGFKKRYTEINGDLTHFGELTRILGKENVITLYKMHPMYFNGYHKNYTLAPVEKYPTIFDFLEPTYMPYDKVLDNLSDFDAIIWAYRSGDQALEIVKRARKKNILVVFFDKFDHPAVYTTDRHNLYRGFDKKLFDICFKQDLPLDCDDRYSFPISPVPTTYPEQMNNIVPWNEKKYSIMFRGDYRKGYIQPERNDICILLKEKFDDAHIVVTSNQRHVCSEEKQERVMLSSKILLSPGGVVWDSFRHCSFAKFGVPIVLPKPNCKIVPQPFTDMENCVQYETEYKNGYKVLKNGDKIVDRLKSLVADEKKCKKIGQNYLKFVQKYHTRKVRAEYILRIMNNVYEKGVS